MAGPPLPPGFRIVAPAPPIPDGFRVVSPAGGAIDLHRQPETFVSDPSVMSHRAWWDANYQRLGLPQLPTTLEQITQARQQNDPQGFAAYEQSPQGLVLAGQGTTENWNQPYDTNNTPMDWLRGAGQGVFGLGDEAEGVVGGIGGLLSGKGFPAGYDRSVTNARGEIAEFGNEHPGIERALELAGGLATAAIPAGWAARGGSMLARAGRGLLGGTAAGALQGAGASEGTTFSERANDALRAAIPTGILGAGLPVIAPAMARALRGIIPERAGATTALPTVEGMRDDAQAAYRRADAAGLTVAAQPAEDFALNAYQGLLGEGMARSPDIAARLTPKASAAMDLLLSEAGRGQHSLRDLENLRRMVSGAAGGAAPDDTRLVLSLRDDIDDWLDNLKPADIVAGNPQEAIAALREGRALWSRMRKTEIIEDIENRAQISVGQSVNASGIEQALRREFGNLAKNAKRMARFSDEEQAAIRSITDVTTLNNVLRRLSTFAPRGFFSTALGILGASTGNLPMMGLTVTGELAKRGRDAMTRTRVGELNSIVRTGNPGAGLPTGATGILGTLQAGNMSQTPRAGALLPPSIVLPQWLPVR